MNACIAVDYSSPLDLLRFNADYFIIEETRNPKLDIIDLAKVRLESLFLELSSRAAKSSGSDAYRYRKKIDLLKEYGYHCLGAKDFEILWKNPHLIPEEWKERRGNITSYIMFDGTVFRDWNGHRCVLCLYWHTNRRWAWKFHHLDYGTWHDNDYSAVLVS